MPARTTACRARMTIGRAGMTESGRKSIRTGKMQKSNHVLQLLTFIFNILPARPVQAGILTSSSFHFHFHFYFH